MAGVELLDEIVVWPDTLQRAGARSSGRAGRPAGLVSRAPMPFSRSLAQGQFELRFTLGSTARRISYRFTKDGRIVLLMTFRKQRNNERTEIERARRQPVADAAGNP